MEDIELSLDPVILFVQKVDLILQLLHRLLIQILLVLHVKLVQVLTALVQPAKSQYFIVSDLNLVCHPFDLLL